MSQQMRALVGTPLFTRAGRTMRLAEAGEVLARHAASVPHDLDAAQNQIAAIRQLRAGNLRICSFPSASATIVPAATAHIARDHPDLRIRLIEAEPPDSMETSRRGECDVASRSAGRRSIAGH